MNALDNAAGGGAGQSGGLPCPPAASLEGISGLLEALALGLLANRKPPPELLRAVNRSLVGPFRWAGLQLKRERLGLLREKSETESCGRFSKWVRDTKAREIAESSMSNAEKIALLRQALFADVDKLERSGEIVLPD
jgi:hypothetical protein